MILWGFLVFILFWVTHAFFSPLVFEIWFTCFLFFIMYRLYRNYWGLDIVRVQEINNDVLGILLNDYLFGMIPFMLGQQFYLF